MNALPSYRGRIGVDSVSCGDPASFSPSPSGSRSSGGGDSGSGSGRLPVLLVEDNPADVFVITEIIKQWRFPYDLQVAPDSEKALSLLERCEKDEIACPALVLLDLNLPRGQVPKYLFACAKVRAAPAFQLWLSPLRTRRVTWPQSRWLRPMPISVSRRIC